MSQGACSLLSLFLTAINTIIMKAPKYLILFLCCALGSPLISQQLPIFTQYREYYSVLNPASLNMDYITGDYNVSFGASYRVQWLEKNFGPKTAMARGEYIGELGNVDFVTGGHLILDDTGPSSVTGAYGRLGFIVGNSTTSGLVLGLSAGLVQQQIDANELSFFQDNDDLQNIRLSKMVPDVAAGLYYFSFNGRNTFYSGVSIPQVLGLEIFYDQLQNTDFKLTRVRHYYGIVGFLRETDLGQYLDLSGWVKFVPGAPINVDVLARYQLQRAFWVGAGLSSRRAAHLEAGLVLDNYSQRLKIGYGFDMNFTTYNQFFGSSHEINLSYAFSSY